MDDIPVLRVLSHLASPNLGCVTTASLIAANISEDRIASLVQRGALTRVVRSVYVAGADEITHAQLGRVALLLADRGGHKTGRSAAEANALLGPKLGEVSVARTGKRARPPRYLRTEIVVSETGRPARITLATVGEHDAEWELIDGEPIESIARALCRLADGADRSLAQRAWREADYRKLLLRAAVDAQIRRGWPGSDVLAALLVAQPPREVDGDFRSRAEMRLWDALVARGVSPPRVNHLTEIGGRKLEPDFFFVDEQLIVEADGPQHLLPTRAAEDAERDAHVRAHGIEVLRFPDTEIDADADLCAATVEHTLLERRRR